MRTLLKYIKNSIKLAKISNPTERYVAQQLQKNLPSSDYAVINDLLIPYKRYGRTSQIDHIVVSIYGIFCIETKSHKGWILGVKAREIFQQILFRDRYNIRPNPVNQNMGHIDALNEVLGKKLKAPIMNIVVFPSAEKLMIYGYTHVERVFEVIEEISEQDKKVYTYQEAASIIAAICAVNIKAHGARKKHVADIRAMYSHA